MRGAWGKEKAVCRGGKENPHLQGFTVPRLGARATEEASSKCACGMCQRLLVRWSYGRALGKGIMLRLPAIFP